MYNLYKLILQINDSLLVKVALCGNGRCDAAFSGGNCCVESDRCDHQQIAAVFVARRVRVMS